MAVSATGNVKQYGSVADYTIFIVQYITGVKIRYLKPEHQALKTKSIKLCCTRILQKVAEMC